MSRADRPVRPSSPRSIGLVAAGLAGLAASAPAVRADLGAEDVLLVIDPNDPEALYLGHRYRDARGIPDRNVLYLVPGASDYAAFVAERQPAALGTLAQRRLAGHVDMFVLAPVDEFFVPASGYVTDGCVSVRRFSLASAFGLAKQSEEILGGGIPSTRTNRYGTVSFEAIAFDTNVAWFQGEPSIDPDAESYYIGTMLGYTGERGNTVTEIEAMIDRSVAADGTRPEGTFYFLETNDSARSDPRDGFFDDAATDIIARGGQAEASCCSPLPTGADDVLGAMSGFAGADILGGDFTILPGAFADHLTSFAATFDTGSQTKMSEWIAKGASGTIGTVEEPCNYPGKFPRPQMHAYYFQGLTLGEATWRSLGYWPFQPLLTGDPLTRPFAWIPTVTVDGVPTGPVGGIVELVPSATTDRPGARILEHELLVDGEVVLVVPDGEPFRLDTTRLGDGHHELRVRSRDDTAVASTVRWIGAIDVDNAGRSVELLPAATSGDLSTPFVLTSEVETGAGTVVQVRLVQHGRVVASGDDPTRPLTTYGAALGSGPSRVRAEVEFADGMVVRPAPVGLDISRDVGGPVGVTPEAFGYRRTVDPAHAALLELPVAWDDADASREYRIVTPPTQATLSGTEAEPYRLLVAEENATGSDHVEFEVVVGGVTSGTARIDLFYDDCLAEDPTLAVGPLDAGEIGTATLTCGFPEEPAYLAYSTIGEGRTFIAPLNVTLGLVAPRQAGEPVVTDSSGTATWSLPAPNVQRATLVWFQVAQRSSVSNVVLTQINP